MDYRSKLKPKNEILYNLLKDAHGKTSINYQNTRCLKKRKTGEMFCAEKIKSGGVSYY